MLIDNPKCGKVQINYPEIDMDAKGNKLSSCKIPDQYLKKQKLLNF